MTMRWVPDPNARQPKTDAEAWIGLHLTAITIVGGWAVERRDTATAVRMLTLQAIVGHLHPGVRPCAPAHWFT